MANLGVIVLLLLPFAASVPGVPPTMEFIYGDCSPTTYAPESPFARNLYSLLLKLADSAYNFTMITSPSQSDVVHGLYQCRGDLSQQDCSSCVRRSVIQVCAMCPVSSAAAVQLQGCYLKYDNTSFLGVEDTSIIYKKFVPSVGYDYRKLVAWDAVLTGLLKGDTYYRVANSKDVRGVAQCVGDLSAGQCQNCVSDLRPSNSC